MPAKLATSLLARIESETRYYYLMVGSQYRFYLELVPTTEEGLCAVCLAQVTYDEPLSLKKRNSCLGFNASSALLEVYFEKLMRNY